jgi:uncharacterized glyoxalase superfamily protein PhnB
MQDPRVCAILETTDMAATLDWYERAGFAVRGRSPRIDATWAEVARDGLAVQFLAGDTPWPEPPAFTGCFYAYPASVDAVAAELAAALGVDCRVQERDWGAREVTLQDPNGYWLTFTQQLDE